MKTHLKEILLIAAMAFPVSLLAVSPSQPETAPEVKAANTPQPGPSGIISTVAGDGLVGDNGNGRLATKAQFIYPQSVVVDSVGNLYIADPDAEVVRKVTASTGIISIYAGTGVGGYSGDNGPATAAKLDMPWFLALDSSGNLYISDLRNNVVREVKAKTSIITTVAGNGYGASIPGYPETCGTLTLGVKATTTALCWPDSLAADSAGNLYIGDDNRVLKVAASTGIVSSYAGNGNMGYSGDGGLAMNAELSSEMGGLALDKAGNLYIADTDNCAIRKVTATTGVITSLVGAASSSGNSGSCIFGANPGDGGLASKASIIFPMGVAVDAGGDLFVADSHDGTIRVIAASNQKIYTVAGWWNSNWGYSGDGGPAAGAYLSRPEGIALDASGNLYIADEDNYVIRKVAQATVLPNETPVIKPGSSSISTATLVTISSPVTGATIYYTITGTTPSTSSTVYQAPFAVSNSETVEAFATLPGGTNTAAAVANYLFLNAPAATTQAATGVTATGATLNGTVNGENATTQYWFAYGTSQTALTQTTGKTYAQTVSTAIPVTAALTGLTAGKTYYFKVVAQNTVGSNSGKVMSFTTK